MVKPLLADRPVRGFERVAAGISLAAAALFIALVAALHGLEPELDPTWRFISEYALGRFGWLMSFAFAALAVSLLGTALTVVRHVRTVLGYLGLAIITVGAIGLLIAAAFVTDPITTPAEAYTSSGQLHVLGASLDYSPVGMLLTGWALSRTPGWRPHRRALMITAALAVVITVGFVAALPQDGQFGPGVYAGLIGRLLLTSYVGWIGVVGVNLLRMRFIGVRGTGPEGLGMAGAGVRRRRSIAEI